MDTTTGVFYVPPGSAAPTSLITKTQSKQSSFFGVGNYLYIGNPGFSNKWDGPSGAQGITKWGIAIGSVNNAIGPNLTGNGVNDGTSGPAWSNPNNVTSAVSYATIVLSGIQGQSQGINCTQFGFAIPSTNTISGIQITADIQLSGGIGTDAYIAYLLRNGTRTGVYETVFPSSSPSTITFGGAGDTWGTTWTPNDINQATWGVAIAALNQVSTSFTFSLRHVQATIFGTGGPTVVVNAGAGSFSATQGYQYVFCFGNSNDNNISNPTPTSVSTGVFTSKLRVEISVTASTDPQVNQIRVFRTTDTGTGAVFFELPNSPFPNTTATVFDTAADTALQVTQAVVAGTVAFSPPPPGLVNIEWYAGRLWGSVGNLLYFSAGPDNTPMGRGTSNWPPGNVFELPTQIVKNAALNGGNGMLVVTLDGVHVVQGISNPGFTVNKWLSDVGARQQNAVDTDGSNIYIFTSDRQFLRISSQGIEELSQYVSDQTDSLDPTLVYVCQHRSGSQDSRVFLTDGSTKWIPYNLMMGAWEPAKTTVDGSGVGAISSIETTPGVFKLLKGDTRASQVIQQRDQNTFSDNGTNYSWNVVFGNIPLADPTQLANVESLVLRLTNAGSLPVVSILPGDISGAFTTLGPPKDEPPEGSAPPTGYQAKKYYLGTGKAWTQMTHLQIQFSFGAEAAQNEILSWGLFPNESTDQQVGAIPQIQGR